MPSKRRAEKPHRIAVVFVSKVGCHACLAFKNDLGMWKEIQSQLASASSPNPADEKSAFRDSAAIQFDFSESDYADLPEWVRTKLRFAPVLVCLSLRKNRGAKRTPGLETPPDQLYHSIWQVFDSSTMKVKSTEDFHRHIDSFTAKIQMKRASRAKSINKRTTLSRLLSSFVL